MHSNSTLLICPILHHCSARFFLVGLFAVLGLSQEGFAQKTLFSMPTSEITEQKKLFFQQQVNVADHVQSSTTFTYGFGHQFEVGISLDNLTFDGRPHHHLIELNSPEPAENPHLLVNAQKGFELTNWLNIGVGTRTGATHQRVDAEGHGARYKVASFSFLSSELVIPGTEIKFNLGSYYVNQAFAGPGTDLGYMVGADIPLIKDKLHFEADYLSGTSALSVGTVGLEVLFAKGWQLGAGIQLPSPGSNNPQGIAIQLSSH